MIILVISHFGFGDRTSVMVVPLSGHCLILLTFRQTLLTPNVFYAKAYHRKLDKIQLGIVEHRFPQIL